MFTAERNTMMTTPEQIFENHNDRLIEAEGKIFALTHLVRELLSVANAEPEVTNSHLVILRDAMAPDETMNEPTIKFIEAARAVFGQLITGAPPTRPTFTVISGGKSEPD
jgi:hypothetical protein